MFRYNNVKMNLTINLRTKSNSRIKSYNF